MAIPRHLSGEIRLDRALESELTSQRRSELCDGSPPLKSLFGVIMEAEQVSEFM